MAAECPPTFGTDPQKITACMAGGPDAVFRSKEGAENDPEGGVEALSACTAGDLVIGIAASGVTPYIQGALRRAREIGAITILLTCNPGGVERTCADLVIGLPVGPEVLAGLTRLKAGTATKRALNILSTGAMVRSGKVFCEVFRNLQP